LGPSCTVQKIKLIEMNRQPTNLQKKKRKKTAKQQLRAVDDQEKIKNGGVRKWAGPA
jgi:hypothetical protein